MKGLIALGAKVTIAAGIALILYGCLIDRAHAKGRKLSTGIDSTAFCGDRYCQHEATTMRQDRRHSRREVMRSDRLAEQPRPESRSVTTPGRLYRGAHKRWAVRAHHRGLAPNPHPAPTPAPAQSLPGAIESKLAMGLHALARFTHDPRPHAWCGWYMRQELRVADRRYNLARNWAGYGSPAHGPAIGAIVVWSHHVGRIIGKSARGEWIVQSGNDGHAVRSRPRSVARAIAFRWPV